MLLYVALFGLPTVLVMNKGKLYVNDCCGRIEFLEYKYQKSIILTTWFSIVKCKDKDTSTFIKISLLSCCKYIVSVSKHIVGVETSVL